MLTKGSRRASSLMSFLWKNPETGRVFLALPSDPPGRYYFRCDHRVPPATHPKARILAQERPIPSSWAQDRPVVGTTPRLSSSPQPTPIWVRLLTKIRVPWKWTYPPKIYQARSPNPANPIEGLDAREVETFPSRNSAGFHPLPFLGADFFLPFFWRTQYLAAVRVWD